MVYLWFNNNMVKKKKNLNQNILVTGGSGFIGSAITKYLVKRGKRVIVFDNNSRGKLRRLKDVQNKIKFIRGDIRDKKKLRQINNVDSRGEMNMYEDGEEITIPLKKPIQGKKEFTATVDADAGFTSFSFETEDQEAMESVGIDIDDLSDFMTDSMF